MLRSLASEILLTFASSQEEYTPESAATISNIPVLVSNPALKAVIFSDGRYTLSFTLECCKIVYHSTNALLVLAQHNTFTQFSTKSCMRI